MKTKFNKKIILSSFILLLIFSFAFISRAFISKNYHVTLDSVSLRNKVSNSNSSFAIMVENDDGEYEEYSGTSWPTDMVFNEENSVCTDSKGNTISSVLTYNSSTNQVSVTANESFYCYLYFDKALTLHDAILLAENDSDTVDDAVTYIKSKGTPTFSSTSTTDDGLYYAEDDYGDSYYFRGAVTDNYVYFAGFYWRIIRINGDGSIRMIYDGSTQAYDNGDSTNYADRYISKSVFNTLYGNNAFVGYMYGDVYTENATTETTLTLQSYYYYYSSSYTFDTDTGYYTLGDDAAQAVWKNRNLVGYYTCRSTSTTCTTLYYIIDDSLTYKGIYYTYSRTSETDDDGNTTYTESQGTSTTTGIFATMYYYGTGYTYDSKVGYTLTGYAFNVYDGTGTVSDLTGYYTCGSDSYTNCTTLYYIESASTAQIANVTKYSLTANSYATTHANINDSTIKGVVDYWYATNIYNASDGTNSYDDYISDTLFCNDRSVYSGTGTGQTAASYGANNRLYTNKSPILTCPQQNDAFTVSDTTNGNGDLTYKVGLITADEVAMAGGVYKASNSNYYLSIGAFYWTMSPVHFSGSSASSGARVWTSGSTASLYNLGSYVSGSDGVRPVINLSSSVILTNGDGTKDSPYEVALS